MGFYDKSWPNISHKQIFDLCDIIYDKSKMKSLCDVTCVAKPLVVLEGDVRRKYYTNIWYLTLSKIPIHRKRMSGKSKKVLDVTLRITSLYTLPLEVSDVWQISDLLVSKMSDVRCQAIFYLPNI